MQFLYDATGNRIAKLLKNANAQAAIDTTYAATYYWHDAQGNVLTTESKKYYPYPTAATSNISHTTEVEYNIYGSSRLGTLQDTIAYDITTLTPYGKYVRYYARRQYELSNHLGNVMATVSDVKTYSGSGYSAKVLSAQNYFPFGMQMPGKFANLPSYSSLNKYRYGFNGKENMDEIYGKGNMPDLGDRMEDVRLCRMNWGIDRKASSYPWQSPYAYNANSPIWQIDYNGEGDYYDKNGTHLGRDNKTVTKTIGKGKNARQIQVPDDKAYIADGKNQDGTFSNATELSIKNSELTDFASSIADESSGVQLESYALGNAVVNGSNAEKITIQEFLEKYTSGYDSKISYSNLSDNTKYSMGAAINAITSGFDYSNGATRWDGRDLLTQGTSHYRYSKAYYDNRKGIFIPTELQSEVHSYIENVLYYYASKEHRNDNLFMNAYENQIVANSNQAGSLYTVTKAIGQTIFYKETSQNVTSKTTRYQTYDNNKLYEYYRILMHLKYK